MKTRLIIRLIPTLFLLSLFTVAPAQNNCTCDRHGMLVEFTNPHNPDYEQKLEEWRKCMSLELGNYVSFEVNDPRVAEASGKCAGLTPEDKWYCYPAIIAAFLGEKLTNSCFHMLSNQYFDPGKHKQPEYIFKGSYVANIEGGRMIEYAGGEVTKPVVARLTLQLYYNGTSPELITEWVTENTINDVRGLLNKTKLPNPIGPTLDEFEKRPASCDIEIKSVKELCDKGVTEIELTKFTDEKGAASKPFNRVMVTVENGKILNGEKCEIGPDYRAFTLEEGKVTVKYQRPANRGGDDYDLLRVYNSCDILPPEKYPLSKTLTEKMIAEKNIPLMCDGYEGTIAITKTWNYTTSDGGRYVGSHSVSYNGMFKPIKEMEGMEDQPVKIFKSANVTGQWKYNEDYYCGGSDCDCEGLVFQEYGSGSVSTLVLENIMVITQIFPTENAVVAKQLGQFGMVNWYDIATPGEENLPTQTRRKHHIENVGCVWNESSNKEVLPEVHIRYKLTDSKILQGNRSWQSGMDTEGLEVSNMTEAIYSQKAYEPDKPGNEYTYSVTWHLTAL
ncbi:MAG TPA: hypothetical protein VMW32_04865 [Bacteroidales bacterium]|nr:hypothetical protein [Bacteroidales bacterium]